jgi:hypothetical protein
MKFKVQLVGSFHTLEIYDSRGREIDDLETAVAEAERQYRDEWKCVFNGLEAAERTAAKGRVETTQILPKQ